MLFVFAIGSPASKIGRLHVVWKKLEGEASQSYAGWAVLYVLDRFVWSQPNPHNAEDFGRHCLIIQTAYRRRETMNFATRY